MDERTRKYIGEMVKYPGSKPCDMELSNSIRDKVLGQPPGNYVIEISPNYNPNTGRLESNSKPVGMFIESSSGPRPIATKWTVKDPD